MVLECHLKRKEKKMIDNSKRQKCEIFSRAMGFYRPVSYFNIGKYQEFTERKTFTEEKSLKK